MTWDTDRIIGAGLIIALLVKIGGDVAITLITGSPPNSDVATNIVSGLIGYMSKGFLDATKHRNERT